MRPSGCSSSPGFARIPDGVSASLDGDRLLLANGECLTGVRMTPERLKALTETARENLSVELDHFARNTLEYLNNEKSLLFDAIVAPELRTRFTDRHVLIIVRGEGYKDDLAMLGDYLRDMRPILLAVDGGADALLEARLRPDVILGDMDSISDSALRCGAELIVHAYPVGDAYI